MSDIANRVSPYGGFDPHLLIQKEDTVPLSDDERDDLMTDRGFMLGQQHERRRILDLLGAECECEHDYHCTYHRAITIIEKASK
jgi:hypothetical protein